MSNPAHPDQIAFMAELGFEFLPQDRQTDVAYIHPDLADGEPLEVHLPLQLTDKPAIVKQILLCDRCRIQGNIRRAVAPIARWLGLPVSY